MTYGRRLAEIGVGLPISVRCGYKGSWKEENMLMERSPPVSVGGRARTSTCRLLYFSSWEVEKGDFTRWSFLFNIDSTRLL